MPFLPLFFQSTSGLKLTSMTDEVTKIISETASAVCSLSTPLTTTTPSHEVSTVPAPPFAFLPVELSEKKLPLPAAKAGPMASWKPHKFDLPAWSIFSVSKQISSALLFGTPVEPQYAPYVPIAERFVTYSCGLGAGVALWRLLAKGYNAYQKAQEEKMDRDKVNLAVTAILRTILHNPQVRPKLNDPDWVHGQISKEAQILYQKHLLSRHEAAMIIDAALAESQRPQSDFQKDGSKKPYILPYPRPRPLSSSGVRVSPVSSSRVRVSPVPLASTPQTFESPLALVDRLLAEVSHPPSPQSLLSPPDLFSTIKSPLLPVDPARSAPRIRGFSPIPVLTPTPPVAAVAADATVKLRVSMAGRTPYRAGPSRLSHLSHLVAPAEEAESPLSGYTVSKSKNPGPVLPPGPVFPPPVSNPKKRGRDEDDDDDSSSDTSASSVASEKKKRRRSETPSAGAGADSEAGAPRSKKTSPKTPRRRSRGKSVVSTASVGSMDSEKGTRRSARSTKFTGSMKV